MGPSLPVIAQNAVFAKNNVFAENSAPTSDIMCEVENTKNLGFLHFLNMRWGATARAFQAPNLRPYICG